MVFEIVEIEELSGKKAKIYSVMFAGDDLTLLDHFFEDNREFELELREITAKLITMRNTTGCKAQFFRENEGAPGDGVVALRVQQMRLYCLRYDNSCIFVGSGGIKPPGIRAYQEDSVLNAKAMQMREIASCINRAIISRDLRISDDGSIKMSDYTELSI